MGFAGSAGDATMSNQNNTDGIVLFSSTATNASFTGATYNNYISAPLIGCSLSNAEKLVPLDFVNWRLQLTIDSIANICSNLTTDVAFSSFTITNFEVVYNQIQFPSQVHQQIKMQNPKIRIKTKSFGTASQTIPATTNGTINLYYNLRYASVRSLFLSCGGSAAGTSANKLMEALDPTSGNGSIQFSVGGVVMPQQVLSTLNNKAGILNELRRAMGSIYSRNTSMAIGASEYIATPSSVTSITVPGKFYIGINCQKLTEDQDYMFTGVSSANSQINVIINTGTAVSSLLNALLFANYDAIYEIDTLTRQMNYIQ